MKTMLRNLLLVVAMASLPAVAFADNAAVPDKGSGQGVQAGQGAGKAFVDADGDGICDNAKNSGGKGQMNGKGKGQGKGQGKGKGMGKGEGKGKMHGAGFVDANGDGVCDHAQAK